MQVVDPEEVRQKRRRARQLVDGSPVRAYGRRYKRRASLSEARLPAPGSVRPLTEVQRALVATKRPAFSDRGAGFLWLLGKSGMQPRKRDQFFHDALRFCFVARQSRFPVKTSEKCLRALSRRSTGTPSGAAAVPKEAASIPYRPGWEVGVEHRLSRTSYKRKAFKGALADALLRPERAYEPVVLAVLSNVPDGLGHLIGKFRNLF